MEAVALREIAERRVTGDDVLPGAVREAASVVAVELPKLCDEVCCMRGLWQRPGDPAHDALEEDGVEPHVRVGGQPGLLCVSGVER